MPAAPILHADLGSAPEKLITQLVARPSTGARFRKLITRMIHSLESFAAIPIDAELADGSVEEWERALNKMRVSIALAEGAVGRQMDAAVKQHAPEVYERYMRAKRAMLVRARSLAEEVEDKIDAMAADESIAEQGDQPPIPHEAVRAKLGL